MSIHIFKAVLQVKIISKTLYYNYIKTLLRFITQYLKCINISLSNWSLRDSFNRLIKQVLFRFTWSIGLNSFATSSSNGHMEMCEKTTDMGPLIGKTLICLIKRLLAEKIDSFVNFFNSFLNIDFLHKGF